MMKVSSNLGAIYCYHGLGGGKSTNALGLSLRCLGHHKKVVFIQFLKWWKNTGEYKMAQFLKGFQMIQFGRENWWGESIYEDISSSITPAQALTSLENLFIETLSSNLMGDKKWSRVAKNTNASRSVWQQIQPLLRKFENSGGFTVSEDGIESNLPLRAWQSGINTIKSTIEGTFQNSGKKEEPIMPETERQSGKERLDDVMKGDVIGFEHSSMLEEEDVKNAVAKTSELFKSIILMVERGEDMGLPTLFSQTIGTNFNCFVLTVILLHILITKSKYPLIKRKWIGFGNLKEEDKILTQKGLDFAKEIMSKKRKPDLLVLDELNLACHLGLLDVEDVVKWLQSLKETKTTIVLTGRYPPFPLIEVSDYVNEIVCTKAPKEMVSVQGIQW